MAASAATLVLNFDFNDGSVDAIKESVNGLTGSVLGEAPTLVADSPSGQTGDTAIHFEAGQWYQIDDPETKMQINPDDPSFTLEVWVKTDGDPAGRMCFFYSNGPGGAISFSVNTGRTVFVTTLGLLDAGSSAVIPDDGQWHHIAVVHENGVALHYYVDGVLGETRDYASGVIFTRTENRFTLGAEPNGGLQFVGSLDRLRVHSGVLTPAEFDSKPIVGPVVDTDNDGMPNDWETKYGFDPNDPTDAAKDCNNNGVTNLDEFKANMDPCDATKPTIVSIATTSSFDTVNVTFSEVLDEATAINTANYTITPSLAVTGATYRNKVVTLTTAKQTAGGTAYTVAVKGVKDPSKNEVAADTKATFYSYLMTKNGVLKWSYYGDATGGEQIPGTTVDGLLFDARYPSSPDMVLPVYSFSSRHAFPDDSHEYFGATMEGYITPAESGSYRFFVSSDDSSQLFLSTDDTEANLALIAEEPSCCNGFTEPAATYDEMPRTSDPVSLVAGRKYFVRMIYKEGGGGDYAFVAWRKEGDKTPAASLPYIPGGVLSADIEMAYPAEGVFVTQTPAANAKSVKPDAAIRIVHNDGKTPWTADNVTVKLNGVAVTPTFTKQGSAATIEVPHTAKFPSESTQTVTLGYSDPGGNPAMMEWSFEVAAYKGPLKDSVAGIEAYLYGKANQTDDMGGFSGKAGDRAIDFGTSGNGQSVLIPNASFMNAAAAGDKITFVLWAKKTDINNNSGFWADSPSSSGTARGFQAHIPWSDGSIYFDTAGCCDAGTQRLNANIDTFPDYSGDPTWWNEWRHYAFVKNGSLKQVWIDGTLFMEGENTNPLPTDFERIWLGVQGGGPNTGVENSFHGWEDDFAIFGSALTEADIKSLAAGGAPSSLAASKQLLAYWDFNGSLAPVTPTLTFARTATGLTLTFTGSLQSATAVNGPWTDEAGTSPATIPVTGTQKFYRAKQ